MTALEIVVRDLHLLDGRGARDRETLSLLREVIEGGQNSPPASASRPSRRCASATSTSIPPNRALAVRQITVGTLLSLREAKAAALDAPLASLEGRVRPTYRPGNRH